ncbi:MAG: hypothetical protein ACKOQM_00175 [Novosphingobium sp.]
MRRHFATTAFVAALFSAAPAIACSVVASPDYEGSAQQKRDVREAINRATLIVDGEVVRPWTHGSSTLVRVYHVLKGSAGDYIEILGDGGSGDCSITLDRGGERLRLILVGGPKYYELYRDQSEARIEDRILHSDRRKVWPYRTGSETTH